MCKCPYKVDPVLLVWGLYKRATLGADYDRVDPQVVNPTLEAVGRAVDLAISSSAVKNWMGGDKVPFPFSIAEIEGVQVPVAFDSEGRFDERPYDALYGEGAAREEVERARESSVSFAAHEARKANGWQPIDKRG